MPEPRDAKATAKKADEKKEVVVENNAPEQKGEEIVETQKVETPAPVENKAPEETAKVETPVVETKKVEPVQEEAVAQAVAPKQKLYKVKFLENHEFCVGVERHTAKKGDTMKVELHLANLFGQRKIAYMVE